MADQESTQSELRAKLEELIQVLEKVLADASLQENESLVNILAEVPYLVRECTHIYTHYPIELQLLFFSESEHILRAEEYSSRYSYDLFPDQIKRVLELAHESERAYAHALKLALELQCRCAHALELACELNLTYINDLEHICDLALECVSGCKLSHKLITKYESRFCDLVDFALAQRMLQQYKLEQDGEYTHHEFVRRELESRKLAPEHFDRESPFVRLDAAVPEQVFLERAFDVAAAIRLLNSPLLEAEELTKVGRGDAQIVWSEGETRAHLRLQVTAPECQTVGADHHTFFLAKGQESVIFYFHLIPQQIGNITVIVTLYQEHDTLGNTRVRTTVIEHIAGEVQLKVASQPVRITNYNITVQEGGNFQAGVIGSNARVQDGVNFESED